MRCDSLPSDIVWSQACTIAVLPVGPRAPLMLQGGRGGCCAHAQLGSVGTLAPLMDGVPASYLRWVSNSGRPCAQEVPTEWSPCGREQCPNKPSPASFLVHPPLLFPEIAPQKLPAPKSSSWLCSRGIPPKTSCFRSGALCSPLIFTNTSDHVILPLKSSKISQYSQDQRKTPRVVVPKSPNHLTPPALSPVIYQTLDPRVHQDHPATEPLPTLCPLPGALCPASFDL